MEEAFGVQGDHQFFIGRNDPGGYTAARPANARPPLGIEIIIKLQTQPRGLAAHSLASGELRRA